MKPQCGKTDAQGTVDAKRLLAELGGLEIAGMVGVFLGARQYQIPVVLDGAITCVAALAAMRMDAEIVDYLLASHVSEEASGQAGTGRTRTSGSDPRQTVPGRRQWCDDVISTFGYGIIHL